MNAVDRAALAWVNSLVGHSPAAFDAALLLCGQLPLALCVMAMLALWWTDPERSPARTGVIGGFAPQARPGLEQSRLRAAMLALSVAGAFVVARLTALLTNWPRPLGREPLAVPLDPAVWAGTVEAMTGFGAFPSDHAALFFAVAVGLFSWHPAAGIVGLLAAALFSAARVAVGFHYPADVLAGGLIGALAAGAGRLLTPAMTPFLSPIVGLFERRPAVMYPLLFVAALDFTHHFQLLLKPVFAVVFKVLGATHAI